MRIIDNVRYYTGSEVSKLCDIEQVSLARYQQDPEHPCPSPSKQIGRRWFYTLEDLEKIKAYFEWYSKLLTAKDMCQRVGTWADVLANLQTSYGCPKPSIRIGRSSYYTEDDVEAVRKALAMTKSYHLDVPIFSK